MSIIRELRLKKGLSQTELAEVCGVHQTAVSQWEKGRTTPDAESLRRLAEALGVSADQILGTAGEGVKRHLVPVLGYVRAGIPLEAIEEIIDYEEITPETAALGEHFGLKITGESMMPRFCPGDVVIVRRQTDVDNGDIAVVLVNGLDATVKKVIKTGSGIMLMPLNSVYEPTVYMNEEIDALPVSIIGKVVELRGKFA